MAVNSSREESSGRQPGAVKHLWRHDSPAQTRGADDRIRTRDPHLGKVRTPVRCVPVGAPRCALPSSTTSTASRQIHAVVERSTSQPSRSVADDMFSTLRRSSITEPQTDLVRRLQLDSRPSDRATGRRVQKGSQKVDGSDCVAGATQRCRIRRPLTISVLMRSQCGLAPGADGFSPNRSARSKSIARSISSTRPATMTLHPSRAISSAPSTSKAAA